MAHNGELTMFKTPNDFIKTAADALASLPKTPEQFQEVLAKVKNVVDTEILNGKAVLETYTKASKGDASINEITQANKKTQELMIAARFACIMAMPGSIFTVPFLTKLENDLNIDMVPKSVKKEFNI
jgi:hypothetical protein